MTGGEGFIGKALPFIPFLVTKPDGRTGLRMDRVIEAAIIAIVTATVVSWGSVKEIKVQLSYIQKQIDTVDKRVERLEIR